MPQQPTFGSRGRLNYYLHPWDLNVEWCPCDVHFNEFVRASLSNGTIFHFGTGAHHIVGIDASRNGRNNAVFALTASPAEHQAYIDLIIERPEVGRVYKVCFGDIYQLDARLLPDFDLVTLFHLGEYRSEVQDSYGALTDLEVAEVLVERLKPDGRILFYADSLGFEAASEVIDELVRTRGLIRHPDFESLRVYGRREAPHPQPAP